MRSKLLVSGLAAGAVFAWLAGCGNSPSGPTTHIASAANGQYLVQHVMGCGDCHTPTDNLGRPLPGMTLAGGVQFELPFGSVYSRNLTPDNTNGLGTWTDDEIVTAIRTGVAPAHAFANPLDAQLFPVMPYWLYGHLTDNDVHDIVAFLRSLPPVNNAPTPDGIPPFARVTWPTQEGIPDASPQTNARIHGKYLVTLAGCIDCHTVGKADVTGIPTDPGVAIERFLAGGRDFGPLQSKNITPDLATGIGNWTPAQIDRAFSQGIDDEGDQLCPPMPWPVYQGMNPKDRADIVAYLRAIPPVSNTVPIHPPCGITN